VQNVRAALPSVLVEFVRCRRVDPQRRYGERYLAYLVTPRGPLQWVPLGDASSLDAEIDEMMATMNGDVPADVAIAALRRIDARVFAPIRARLTDVTRGSAAFALTSANAGPIATGGAVRWASRGACGALSACGGLGPAGSGRRGLGAAAWAYGLDSDV